MGIAVRGAAAGRKLHVPQVLGEAFWGQVLKTNDCWTWAGTRNGHYGLFRLAGRQVYAHRAAYALQHGDIPPGMVIRHTCDNPLCVRPNHLAIGTQRQNVSDAMQSGTMKTFGLPFGPANPCAKLSLEEVAAVRQEYASGATTQGAIAERYGTRQSTVSKIVRGLLRPRG